MTKQGKRELLKAVRPRYLKADKNTKSLILDEFVAATGYNRKYAISLLRNGLSRKSTNKSGRQRIYGNDVVAALVKVWEVCGNLCGKRLRPFLPYIVDAMERHGELSLSDEIKAKLLQMSSATIDRRLKRARSRLARTRRSTTRPGTLLKHAIPIRTYADWDEQLPGFVEMDLVAHCGDSTGGEYLHTLNVVDIDTRWTEPVALANRSQKATFDGICAMRERLPFPLQGIDSDGGSEFINHHLYQYCQKEQITFTRSRPYRKNDQAHVEQKNWTVVRQVVGYRRYESQEALEVMCDVYDDLRLFVNFFQPVMKLVSKTRIGSRVRKKYDKAQTPYQRIMASQHVDKIVKEQLTELYLTLNPVELKVRIEKNLDQLWKLNR